MTTRQIDRPRASLKVVAAVAVLVCLVLAGIASHYASDSPDGLNKVAADTGLSDHEEQSAAAGSPLAGYETKDVDNGLLSGSLAGVAGVVTVLALAGGVTLALRRRGADDDGG